MPIQRIQHIICTEEWIRGPRHYRPFKPRKENPKYAGEIHMSWPKKGGIKAKSSLLTFSFSECFDLASLGSGIVAPESGRLTVIPSSHGEYV